MAETLADKTAAEWALESQASAVDSQGSAVAAEGHATAAAASATKSTADALVAANSRSASSISAEQAQLAASNAAMGIYRIKKIPIAGANVAINPDADVASYYEIMLLEPTTTIIITDPTMAEGYYQQLTISLIQGSGANKVVWPEKVKWAFGRPPVLDFKASHMDIVTLVYRGDGKWFGTFTAGGFDEV
ncbi:tail fiber protein [Stenotrophomonas phage Philippe]|uniref:Tail fiber protein n=1 Tax=Stenotrophomonas phage Philippe TaxID=2859655 RepID=A0AAE7WNH1_9CAUD|nr:tail fiber protein [Stenotrophomonas phage Philippe]QYW02285.1 hypothetical protein CPT_Philippe_092 [Stenotrophomonas phage Philippe]